MLTFTAENNHKPIAEKLAALVLDVEHTEASRDAELGQWYVAQVEPRREPTVRAGLIGRRFTAYCPEYPKKVRRGHGKLVVVNKPLTPGYVYVRFDLLSDRWKKVFGVSGLTRVLPDNDPMPVPEWAIDRLRRREAVLQASGRRHGVIYHMPGDVVQLVDHALAGFFAKVIKVFAARGRISLEIDIFGRQTPLEVSVNQVRAV